VRLGVALAALWFSSGSLAAGNAADMDLIRSAERGDAARVRQLVAAGADVRARDNRGRTALLAATQHDRVEIAKLLIAAGADVNAKDQIDDSPYLLAGARGYVEILRATLAAGADLASTNRYGGTALIPACHYGHVEAVRELLRTRIDVDHVNRLGWTALLEAVILGDGGARHTEIVRLLIAHKAAVNLPDRQGVTPLAHARSRGFHVIGALLEAAGAR
jgi:ankyrin repeat protein